MDFLKEPYSRLLNPPFINAVGLAVPILVTESSVQRRNTLRVIEVVGLTANSCRHEEQTRDILDF